MRRKEAAELWAWGSVVNAVELQTASRAGLCVGALRVLVRLAALTAAGALVRCADLTRAAAHYDGNRDAAHLRKMGKPGGHVVLSGGKNGTGTYSLSPAGLKVCKEYAQAWRRAVGQVERFEPVQPWRRLKPLPTSES